MTEPAHDHERDPDVGRDVRRLDGWAVLATAAEMAGRGQDHLRREERVRLQGVPFELRPSPPQPVVGAGLTLGGRFPLGDELSLATDVGGYRFFRDELSFKGHDEMIKGRILVGYTLAPRLTRSSSSCAIR